MDYREKSPARCSTRSRILRRPMPVLAYSASAGQPRPLSISVSSTRLPWRQADVHLAGVGVALDIAQPFLGNAEQRHGFGRLAIQRGHLVVGVLLHGDAGALGEIRG